jgi:two-component system LytT family response regulator
METITYHNTPTKTPSRKGKDKETLTAIIVEDEEKGMNNLKNMLAQHCPDVQLIGEARSVQEGIQLLADGKVKPDLAFLDINLTDGQVFQMLDKIAPIDFEIIFVTAFEEYAIKACEYSSIGYIVKPIDPDMLRDSVNRVYHKRSSQINNRLEIFNTYYNNPNAFRKMSISALDGIYFINIADILRFEADDNYTHIHLLTGERITASKTIKSYEELLAPFNFYRVHKRHVINLNYMQKFVKGDGGYLIMDDGKKIEVSRRRRPAFMEQMRRLQEGL